MTTYREAEPDYMDRRRLQRPGGAWSLWGLGVAAAVSGQYFGWNFGLAEGGYGGLLVAALLVTLLYGGLASSLAELSAALPHAGGAYAYGRAALGPVFGLIAGLGQTIAYVLAPAVIVLGIGGYLGALFATPEGFAPIWWLVAYGLLTGLNLAGARLGFAAALGLGLAALAALAVFALGAISHFSPNRALELAAGGQSLFPMGAAGIAAALPFVLWLYFGLESVALAAEETKAPVADLPKAILLAFASLALPALLVVVLAPAIPPGGAVLGQSREPLVPVLQTIFGADADVRLLALAPLVALLASGHALLFAAGRNLYSLSRAGYLPQRLSLTRPGGGPPRAALIAAAGLGFAAAVAIHYGGRPSPGPSLAGVLVNMAALGLVLSCLLQLASFLILRAARPGLARPFRAPLGELGAWSALIVATSLFLALIAGEESRAGLPGCVTVLALGVVYYRVRGRSQLVAAPEEQAALEAEAETNPDGRVPV